MRLEHCADKRMLRLKAGDMTLVKRPDWGEALGHADEQTALVVVDLQGVEFVSSLFLTGCVELRRALAEQGRQLVLLHVSPQQERLLDLVAGAAGIPIARDEDELAAHLAAAVQERDSGSGDEGVTRSEKTALWG